MQSILIVNDESFRLNDSFKHYYADSLSWGLLKRTLKSDIYDKIIFVELKHGDVILKRCIAYGLQDKMYLILYESKLINSYQYSKKLHKHFKKIFTWDDDLVDGEQGFE